MGNITFKINDEEINYSGNLLENARDFLKKEGYNSVRWACDGEGMCGLCSIILEKKVVNSCLLRVGQLEGKTIYTLEHFANKKDLDLLQESMLIAGVVQCGYCSGAIYLALRSLLNNIENPTKEEIKNALSSVFCRCTGYKQFFDVIEIYKAIKNGNKIIEEKKNKNLKVVGTSQIKKDGPKLIRCENAYTEDYVPKNTYIMKMLRSPYASAYIKNIDTSEAENLKGIKYILTYKNSPKNIYSRTGQNFPEPSPLDRQMMGQKVYHVGDRVAAIVAKNEEVAIEAMKKIKVDYEILKPVTCIDDAKKDDATIVRGGKITFGTDDEQTIDLKGLNDMETPLHYYFPIGADPKKNIAGSHSIKIGNPQEAFDRCDKVIERTYKTKKVQAMPTETHSVYTRLENGRLIITAGTQTPFHKRRLIASALGIPETKIRVIKEHIGGGFGAKQDLIDEEVVAYLTWKTGISIYYRLTREEEFIASTSRHDSEIKIKIGGTNDGKILALDIVGAINTGGYGNHAWTVAELLMNITLSMFTIENIKYDTKAYFTNLPNSGAYRGYGVPQGAFAIITAVNELAKELNSDILEMYKKNTVKSGQKLITRAHLIHKDIKDAQLLEGCGLEEAINLGAEMIKWNEPSELIKEPYIKRGKGVAIAQQESGLPNLDSGNATIKMIGDGGFIVHLGGTDIGTGLVTVSAQLVAEHLKIDYERIHVISSDTDNTPFDVGSYASSGTHFSAGAVLEAAKAMKNQILKEAAKILCEPIEDLELIVDDAGLVKSKSSSVSFEKIAQLTQSGVGCGQLISVGNYTTDKNAIPYAAHYSEVEVNENTGQVKILKYYAIHDCGTPINPTLAKGQIYGGVMQAIGHTLYEEMKFDKDANCLNKNMLDYKLPSVGEIPEDFKVEFVHTHESGELYSSRKSVGEISIALTAPSISTAIHDATGIWMREWPFTPEKILKALGKIK